METPTESKQLARSYAFWRRVSAIVLIGFSLLLVVGCSVLAWFTGEVNDFYGGLFYGLFPLLTLIYIHFYLLNPWRDPQATQRRLEVVQRKQNRNAASVAIWNGWMMLAASPVLLLKLAGKGAEEGVWQMVAGGVVALLFGGAGVAGIRWGRHRRRAQ